MPRWLNTQAYQLLRERKKEKEVLGRRARENSSGRRGRRKKGTYWGEDGIKSKRRAGT
jgi:hypothetical protein